MYVCVCLCVYVGDGGRGGDLGGGNERVYVRESVSVYR